MKKSTQEIVRRTRGRDTVFLSDSKLVTIQRPGNLAVRGMQEVDAALDGFEKAGKILPFGVKDIFVHHISPSGMPVARAMR